MAPPEFTQQTPSNVLPNYEDPSNNYYGTANNTSALYNSNAPNSLPASPLGQVVRRQTDNQMVPMMSCKDTGKYDDLDRRALIAKRDAQTKRRQIPPFIQKLSSFLDDNTRNTDLIRWSESGDSFIVVDENEFAKALIPELFKHNNYASFVRQLNMYGFHKEVSLLDNSMRASERKNKNSKYSNPYFKRGKPSLLWLIHKPSPANSLGKGGAKEDVEDESDELFIHTDAGNVRQPLMLGNVPNSCSPKQLAYLKRELAETRQNQLKIIEMLHIVRKEHHQLGGQANAFHDLHEEHKNSINSILTFLKSMDQQLYPGLPENSGRVSKEYNRHRTPSARSSYQPKGELDFEYFLKSGEYFNDGTNPCDFDF